MRGPPREFLLNKSHQIGPSREGLDNSREVGISHCGGLAESEEKKGECRREQSLSFSRIQATLAPTHKSLEGQRRKSIKTSFIILNIRNSINCCRQLEAGATVDSKPLSPITMATAFSTLLLPPTSKVHHVGQKTQTRPLSFPLKQTDTHTKAQGQRYKDPIIKANTQRHPSTKSPKRGSINFPLQDVIPRQPSSVQPNPNNSMDYDVTLTGVQLGN